MQIDSVTLTMTLDLLNPKSNSIEDYCAKFHIIAIRGFRFIVPTYTRTPTHPLNPDKVIAILVPPYTTSSAQWCRSVVLYGGSGSIRSNHQTVI